MQPSTPMGDSGESPSNLAGGYRAQPYAGDQGCRGKPAQGIQAESPFLPLQSEVGLEPVGRVLTAQMLLRLVSLGVLTALAVLLYAGVRLLVRGLLLLFGGGALVLSVLLYQVLRVAAACARIVRL